MQKILIIGTGNLGKRYLQAASQIKNAKLFLHDISVDALDSIEEFLRNNSVALNNYSKIRNFEQALDQVDSEAIIVVACTAAGRKELLQSIIKKTPKAVICEKPVTQTSEDYEDLLELNKKHKVKIYVNFTLRMQPFYQKIKNELSGLKDCIYNSNLPLMGLACVGIHQIDVFLWLFGLNECKIINTFFDKTYEQKRKGFYDVAGSIELESNGFRAYINNSRYENLRTAQIISSDRVINLIEDLGVMSTVEKLRKGTAVVERIEYAFVSVYMREIIEKIIGNDGSILLPTLASAYLPHNVLFEYLKKHDLKTLNFT